MFSVTTDHRRKMIRLSMSGLFCSNEVAAFRNQLHDAFAAMKAPADTIGVLVDTPGQVLQTQKAVSAFQQLPQLDANGPRVAVVCKGRLLRMQLRRILPSTRCGLFDTMAEAERWLGERERDAAAA